MGSERPRPSHEPNNTPAETVPATPLLPKVEVDEVLAEKMELQARMTTAETQAARHNCDRPRLNPYQKKRKAEIVSLKNGIGEPGVNQNQAASGAENDLNAIDREIGILRQHPARRWTFPTKEDGEFVPLSPFQRASAPPTSRDQYQSLLESLVDDGIIDGETAEDFGDVQMIGNANGPGPTPIRNVPFTQPSKMSPIVEDSFDSDSRP